jgi:hypothetical protein
MWRIIAVLLLVAAVALGIYFLSCNGKGGGLTASTGSSSTSGTPPRCAVRVAATGITVDGKPTAKDAVVAACKGRPGADVVVTGDAREGDWDDLKAALDAGGVTIYLKR